MGGKRPDQHNVDPGEPGSSDSKWRREGGSADEPIPDEEKQQPQRKEALRRNEERGMSADERVDEASEESFPASDPPSQP